MNKIKIKKHTSEVWAVFLSGRCIFTCRYAITQDQAFNILKDKGYKV